MGITPKPLKIEVMKNTKKDILDLIWDESKNTNLQDRPIINFLIENSLTFVKDIALKIGVEAAPAMSYGGIKRGVTIMGTFRPSEKQGWCMVYEYLKLKSNEK